MSAETGNGTVTQYREFNGGQEPLLAPGIEGMLQFAGLGAFVIEAKKLVDISSPFLLQASSLFTYYIREIANLHNEALSNSAAIKLLQAFGIAGIGIDKNEKVSEKITAQIVEVHDDLTNRAAESSVNLPVSIEKFSALIAIIQKSIIELLIKSQEDSLVEIEQREEQEDIVEKHLQSKSSGQHVVIYNSVENSQKAQKERRKMSTGEKENIFNQLEVLFSFTKKIFKPAKIGLGEMRAMPMSA